jgi:short-subunit dehydrogenase
VIEADEVARAVVKAIERGRQEVTVPWFPYRISSLAQAVMPRLFSRLVTRRAGEHRDER